MKNKWIYIVMVILLVISIITVVYARQPLGFALMAAALLTIAYFFIRGNKK